MPKQEKDNLFILIKSLSKSEKRQFKLYVGRLEVNEDAKFLWLYNHLEKASAYNESEILNKKIVKKQQLSNLKAHLYKQILTSLRLSPTHQNVRLLLREQLDFASILYTKGLYKQSLKILDRAKNQAIKSEEKIIAYQIIELEKVIESQYITRSISGRADELTVQAKEISQLNVIASKLSNLSLQLYGLFLKTGYVKNEAEFLRIKNYFEQRLPKYDISKLGFREKLWLCKSYLWYSFLVQDFLACYKYSKRWVDLFYENPSMISLNPVFFLRGNQYLLEALFYLRDYKRFNKVLNRFEQIINKSDFPKDDNVSGLKFLYLYNHKLNSHFINGTFKEGEYLVTQILKGIKSHKERIDDHHVMVFYYKIACLYFGMGDNKTCIQYLDKIISNKSLSMREDLLCFSRVLNLVAHYEAGLDYHLESLIKSTYKFLIKMEDLYEVQKEMIKFLKSLGNIYPQQVKQEFIKLYQALKVFEEDPYESRAFLYLDIISWLKSKIENKAVAEIIRDRYLNSNL